MAFPAASATSISLRPRIGTRNKSFTSHRGWVLDNFAKRRARPVEPELFDGAEKREDECAARTTFSQNYPDPLIAISLAFFIPTHLSGCGGAGCCNDLLSNGFTQLHPTLTVSYRFLQWIGIDSACTTRSAKLQEPEISAMRLL